MNMIYRKNRFSPQNKTSASLKLLTTASALALVGCGGGGTTSIAMVMSTSLSSFNISKAMRSGIAAFDDIE